MLVTQNPVEILREYILRYIDEDPEGFVRKFAEFKEWRENPPMLNLKKERKRDVVR